MKKNASSKQPQNAASNQQKTLFQCWKPDSGAKSTGAATAAPQGTSNIGKIGQSKLAWPSASTSTSKSDPILIDDESSCSVKSVNFGNDSNTMDFEEQGDEDLDDMELISTTETFLKEKSFNQNTTAQGEFDKDSDKLAIGIGDDLLMSTQHADCDGFDSSSGSVWIYPNNMPIRSYQYNIVEQCLHKNTMVVLPTGMGKTFIAAVVMFNFYRWYPRGKVVFMAPTKPLVTQQADACYKIVGIPKEDMTFMTGQMAPEKRKGLWSSKRAFFITPQVISNDILRGNLDVNLIKCVVIDEAHKALGDYAYCKVIESINEVNKNFRILALSATPGSDIPSVQNVINKLLISHIELRSDESIDIQQYNHGREVNKFVLKLTDEINKIKNAFVNVMRGPLKRLEMNRAMSHSQDPTLLNKLVVLQRRELFRKSPPPGTDQRKASLVECDFALTITLLHALELLTQYGIKSFYMFLKSFIENTDGNKSAAQQAKLKNEIGSNHEMATLYEKFGSVFDKKNAGDVPREYRHPKLLKLEELILEHFKKFGSNDTRVMVFSQYRESVYEITEMLATHSEIKPMEFVGQSSTSQGTRKSVTQKEQLNVVKKFRDGGYNVLVSTCVGEEGLDIGEVDLIVNYDSQKSPIRLIQRMGRTGRKREGRIIILLTEGKEEGSYKTSLSKKKNIYKIILNGQKHFQFYQNNPLMVPRGMRPKCHQMFITVPTDSLGDNDSKKKKEKATNDETTIKEKKTKKISTEDKPKSKKKGKKEETDLREDDKLDIRPSQPLPDLNFDLDFDFDAPAIIETSFTKPTASKDAKKQTPEVKKETKKLFENCDFLNTSNKKPCSNFSTGNNGPLVPEPSKNIKSILKSVSKLRLNEPVSALDMISQTIEYSVKADDLTECIRMWHLDEDDFLISNHDTVNKVDTMNTSTSNASEAIQLREKFSQLYQELTADLSSDEEDNQNQFEQVMSTEVIINETLPSSGFEFNKINEIEAEKPSISKPESQEPPSTKPINSLNALFLNDDEDEDEDLKYFSQLNRLDVFKPQTETPKLNSSTCHHNIIIDETISNSNLNKTEPDQDNKTDYELTFPTNKAIDRIKRAELGSNKSENSTSTPLRGIVKSEKMTQSEKAAAPELSPFISPMEKQTPGKSTKNVTFLDQQSDVSMVGITQALNLINTPTGRTPVSVLKKSPPVVYTFDMKSSLHDLFNDNDTTKDQSAVYISDASVNFTSAPRDSFGRRSRRLRFDDNSDQSIEEIGEVKHPSVDEIVLDDDSSRSLNESSVFKVAKKKKAVLSSDSDSSVASITRIKQKYGMPGSANCEEEDSEYEEIIGNRSRPNEESELEESEEEIRAIRSRKKNADKFVMDEASASSDGSDEEDGEDLDEYVADSFIDQNETDCSNNDSMYIKYRQSVNDPNNPYMANHFMNRQVRPITDDIFSQMPTQDTSYAFDSFCVPDDHVSIYEKKKKSKKSKKPSTKETERETKARKGRIINRNLLDTCTQSILEEQDEDKENQSYQKPKNLNIIREDEDEEIFVIQPTKTSTNHLGAESKVNRIQDNEDDDDSDAEFNNWINSAAKLTETKVEPKVAQVANELDDEISLILSEKWAGKKNTNWLIVDASLLTAAADIIKNLRKTWDQDKIIFQSSIHCDFILSQRSAVVKLKWTDLNSASNKDIIVEKYLKARAYYGKVVVMIQEDAAVRVRSKFFDTLLAALTRCSPVFFSKVKTEEFTNQLNLQSRYEEMQGFALDLNCKQLLDKNKAVIEFYMSAPHVSILNALYLSKNFPSIQRACNSSLEELKSKGKFSEKKAKKFLKFLIDSS